MLRFTRPPKPSRYFLLKVCFVAAAITVETLVTQVAIAIPVIIMLMIFIEYLEDISSHKS